MFKPHLHPPPPPLCFKRRPSVKALFHGHKDGSQDSGAGPQQLQSLTQIMERERASVCLWIWLYHPKLQVVSSSMLLGWKHALNMIQRVRYSLLRANNQPINDSASVSVLRLSNTSEYTHAQHKPSKVINHREAVKWDMNWKALPFRCWIIVGLLLSLSFFPSFLVSMEWHSHFAWRAEVWMNIMWYHVLYSQTLGHFKHWFFSCCQLWFMRSYQNSQQYESCQQRNSRRGVGAFHHSSSGYLDTLNEYRHDSAANIDDIVMEQMQWCTGN